MFFCCGLWKKYGQICQNDCFWAWEQPLLYFFIFQIFYCKKDRQDQIFEALGKPNGPKQNVNIKNEPVEIIKQRGHI